MNENFKEAFLRAAEDWVCDSYTMAMQYVILKTSLGRYVSNAKIQLNPLPFAEDLNFRIEVDGLLAGNVQKDGLLKSELLEMLRSAADGVIEVCGEQYSLYVDQKPDFYSEMVRGDRWFSDLHLQVSGSRFLEPINLDFVAVDNQLRANDLPFDGLSDLVNWLGLNYPQPSYEAPSIKLRINPPVDIIFDSCKLSDDKLDLLLHAHPNFEVSRVGLAVRSSPGKALEGRKQVSSDIGWELVSTGKLQGVAQVSLEHADSALTMLQIGNTTVRRQWFLDPVKARNGRLMACQLFDKDLRMIRQAVLDTQESERFEKGIAALLFLLGFSPSVQVETDSPDIVATTPSGKVVLIECTLRISDFSKKIGKLIDRCSALTKIFKSTRHHAPVYGALICALPKDQIGSQAQTLDENRLFLICKDDLVLAFDQLRHPPDPDEMVSSAEAKFAQKNMFPNV